MQATQETNTMTIAPRAKSTGPAQPARRAIALLCLLASGVCPVASAAADADTTSVRPALQLRIDAGTQKELLIGKGIDRMAIADETVAGVTVTRQSPNSPAARLIVTGKASGRTTLMIWEKGQSAATIYALEVRRRASTLAGSLDSMEAHQEARDTAMAAGGEKPALIDRSVVNVRSNTVQVEVKIVEFNRTVLKQAGL